MNTLSLRWAHASVDIRLRGRFDLLTKKKSTGVINYASFLTWTRSVSSVTERLQKYSVEIFMWLVSRVGWNIQPGHLHLMNHSERRCSLILVCRRHSTSRYFMCSGLLQVWFGFSSLTTTWRQNPKQAHFFPSGKRLQDYMLPLPLVTQKNWFMFFFFLVSSRISQQRSVSGLALLSVRNVRSSQDLAALWDYSAEQEKHERVYLLSEPREAFHPRMSNKHPPCLSVSRLWFPCVVPFSSVSQRFLCFCFVAL